jgi:acyl carrier protein
MDESITSDLTPQERELADKLIARLKLTTVDVSALRGDTVLFREGLGLDSLDALEIGILVEEDYGIVIGPSERGQSVFGTLRDLSNFIQRNLNRDAVRL